MAQLKKDLDIGKQKKRPIRILVSKLGLDGHDGSAGNLQSFEGCRNGSNLFRSFLHALESSKDCNR